MEPGERVFAVEAADDLTVTLLGFGTYVGDEVPPTPPAMLCALLGCEQTWESIDKTVEEANLLPVEQRPLRRKNPKIVLDGGRVVWGSECWWAPEAQYPDFVKSRAVVQK